MSDFLHLCTEYLRYYGEGLYSFVRTMGPGRYGLVLTFVWVMGIVLLKSGTKRV